MGRRVAVIGASHHRHKFGNKALRAYLSAGYEVFPINPHAREVEGLRAYRSVLDVPGPIDIATIYVPPEIGEQLLDELERKQVAEIWINPGAESDALLADARRRTLNVIQACSIMGLGLRPSEF